MEKNEETFKQTFNVNPGENNQEIRLSSKKIQNLQNNSINIIISCYYYIGEFVGCLF